MSINDRMTLNQSFQVWLSIQYRLLCSDSGCRQEQHLDSGCTQPPGLTHGWCRLGWDGRSLLSAGATGTILAVLTTVRPGPTGPRPQAQGVLRGDITDCTHLCVLTHTLYFIFYGTVLILQTDRFLYDDRYRCIDRCRYFPRSFACFMTLAELHPFISFICIFTTPPSPPISHSLCIPGNSVCAFLIVSFFPVSFQKLS